MRTLYIDGFFVLGLALTMTPVAGPSPPFRFLTSLILCRTDTVRCSNPTHDIGSAAAGERPFHVWPWRFSPPLRGRAARPLDILPSLSLTLAKGRGRRKKQRPGRSRVCRGPKVPSRPN